MTDGQREKDSETGRGMLWITLFLLSVAAAGTATALITQAAGMAGPDPATENVRQAGGILVWIALAGCAAKTAASRRPRKRNRAAKAAAITGAAIIIFALGAAMLLSPGTFR